MLLLISFALLHPESDLGLGVRFLCAPLCVSLLAMVIPSPWPALSGHPSLKHLVAPASALSDSDVGNFPVPSALLPSPNLSVCLSVSLSLSLSLAWLLQAALRSLLRPSVQPSPAPALATKEVSSLRAYRPECAQSRRQRRLLYLPTQTH